MHFYRDCATSVFLWFWWKMNLIKVMEVSLTLPLNSLILNIKLLRELNKTIDIAYVLWFLHCSFYLYFIQKLIKCACEDIPLLKISILWSLLRKGNIQYWKCVRTNGEGVCISLNGNIALRGNSVYILFISSERAGIF